MVDRTGTVWNADEERVKSLIHFMNICDVSLYEFDLNNIYKSLHACKRIGYAQLKDDDDYWGTDEDPGSFKKAMNEMEKSWKKLKDKKENQSQAQLEFVNNAEKAYMELNSAFKDHGLYFRENEDASKAVLKQ